MQRFFLFALAAGTLAVGACANGSTASAGGGSTAPQGPYAYVPPDSPFAQDWAVIAPPP